MKTLGRKIFRELGANYEQVCMIDIWKFGVSNRQLNGTWGFQ
jgi:hypothetical protein